MWSRDLIRLGGAALILALVAGCTLRPAYAPGGSAAGLQGAVAAQAPSDADDFHFVARLSERLGPEQAARFDLFYDITVAVVGQAITPDEVTTRYSLNGSADYRLVDQGSGAVVAQGRVSNFTSYSATGTTVATLTAEGDARKRLMRMLADQVVTRLLAAETATPARAGTATTPRAGTATP